MDVCLSDYAGKVSCKESLATSHLNHVGLSDPKMAEERTRRFTQSGTDIVDIDGSKLRVRWRVTGTQEYVVGDGAAVDGRRFDISLTIFFDHLPDESLLVQELLDRIVADPARPIEVDLGRSRHPRLYCQEILSDSTGTTSGIIFMDQQPPAIRRNQSAPSTSRSHSTTRAGDESQLPPGGGNQA